MKTIGLLGGMSWESTLPYYRLINEGMRDGLGGLHSGKILLHSVDFYEIAQLQKAGRWTEAGMILSAAATGLQQAGAEGLVLCTNTMHKVADVIEENCALPFLHIADAVGTALIRHHIGKALLLGTRYTMEQDFYRKRLALNFGIDTVIPDENVRQEINRIIFEELCVGRCRAESRDFVLQVIADMQQKEVQAVIFGCTEIGLLITPEQSTLPVFDSTVLHAGAAVAFMLDRQAD